MGLWMEDDLPIFNWVFLGSMIIFRPVKNKKIAQLPSFPESVAKGPF